MNKAKRVLALLLCLAMVLAYVPNHIHAADGSTNVSMEVVGTEVKVDDTFTVTLSYCDMYVSSFTAGIFFDNDLLDVVSIVSGDPEFPDEFGFWVRGKRGASWLPATACSSLTDANTNGTVGIAYAGTNDQEFYADKLFTVTFRAVASGSADITLYETTSGTDAYENDSIETVTVTIGSSVPVCQHMETLRISNGNNTHRLVCANPECNEVLNERVPCSGGEATCTAKAKCMACGAEYGELGGHAYGTLIPAQAEVHTQTELKAGVAAHYECSVCDKLFTEAMAETTIEKLTGKTPVHIPGANATCGEDQTCTVCGKVMTAASGNHTFDNDCDATCNGCDYTREVAGHTSNATYPCQTGTCTTCGTTVPPTEDHKVDPTKTKTEQTKAPTCTEEGTEVVSTFCACGHTFKTYEQPISKNDNAHNWGTVDYHWYIDSNSCKAVRVCQNNAEHKEEVTTNITFVDAPVATCMAEGTRNYTATFTGEGAWAGTAETKDDLDKDPTNHTKNNTYVTGYKAATVEAPGYSGDVHCECGAVIETGSVIAQLQGQITVDKVEKVPESVKDLYETVENIADAMNNGIVETYEEVLNNAGLTAEDVTSELHEVVLEYQDPVTNEWVKADEEHFPDSGELLIDLPVPEGTNHDQFTFFVSHMFTSDAFGKEIGAIEYPTVEEVTINGKEYIRFSVTGLSPITVSYAHTDDCSWEISGYTIEGDKHYANYKCTVPGCDKTKKGAENDHSYNDTDHKCVCGAVEMFTLTVNDLEAAYGDAGPDYYRVPFGTNILDFLGGLNIVDTYVVNNEVRVGYYRLDGWNDSNLNAIESDDTVTANLVISAAGPFFGWERYDEEAPWSYSDELGNFVEGWYKIDGAWYYFVKAENGWHYIAQGLTRVPYPTEAINGITYAPNQEDIDYAASKGQTFIDESNAWFVFGEDGKFRSNLTGINEKGAYIANGMIAWHPGAVDVDGEAYYFVGDPVNGGNKFAQGDVFTTRCNGINAFVEGACYNFVDGQLSGNNGMVDGKYYENSRLMFANGLTKVEEGYIYVKRDGKYITNDEYWVPANNLGIVPGMYRFDEDGFMVNPQPTEKNGVYNENGEWRYYIDGKVAYGLGLIEITAPWYGAGDEGGAVTAVVYVKSNGTLATGTYYVTNVANAPENLKHLEGLKQSFGNYGRLYFREGVINGKYYVNNMLAYNAGVVEIEEGKYIYVRSNGEVVKNCSYWITNVGETGVVAQKYSFDENGYFTPVFQNELKNGIVDGVYYVDGKIAYCAGLIKLADENGEFYIYVRSNGELATGSYWPTNKNGIDVKGALDFGVDGKSYI